MQRALAFIHSCARCCLIIPGSPAHSWQQLPNSVWGSFDLIISSPLGISSLAILSSSFDLTSEVNYFLQNTHNFTAADFSTKSNLYWSFLTLVETCLKCDKLGVGDSHSKRRDCLGQSIAQLTGLHLFWPWKFLTEEREPLWNTRCSVWRM